VGLCVLFARLRPGISLRDYFALRWPPKRVAMQWCAGFLLYLAACALASSFLDTSATEEFARAIQSVRGATKVLLWIALYVGAPLTEEFFFRGFLFVGIQRSRLGPVGAIIITTLLFAAIHVQYDLQGLLMVSAASVFFGAARHKTDSLLLCIVLHSIMNVIATVGQS
jgi:membrane protease YdiL (CAAX protease family)